MTRSCVCPGCNAVFAVPENALSPGRSLRCFRCGEAWQVAPSPLPSKATPPEAAPPEAASPAAAPAQAFPPPSSPSESSVSQAAPPDAPSPRPADRLAQPPSRRRGWRHHAAAPLAAAWAVSLLGVFGGGSAALLAHHAIGQAWPPSLRLYRALGLTAAPPSASGGAFARGSPAAAQPSIPSGSQYTRR